MAETKTITCTWNLDNEKTASITLPDPIPNLTRDTADAAMQKWIDNDAILSNNAHATSIAKVQITTTNTIDPA